jgi:hypothetical protein
MLTDPGSALASLEDERLAAGVASTELEELLADACLIGKDVYAIPGFERLRDGLFAALDAMLLPFTDLSVERDGFGVRLAALKDALLPVQATAVPGAVIDRIAATDRKREDSLHLLVMDVHKALNRLQALFAEGSIDGALVFGLADGDETLVKAFMSGLARTAPLKFDHPGLGTTATRAGDRLIIQNDIGTTDAHVLVIHVDPDAIRITYSDVHLPRLSFFCGLFPESVATWDDAQVREQCPPSAPMAQI